MTTPALEDDLRALLDRTAELWTPLKGLRVLMTGGTGFVGRWMLETLSAADRRLGLGVRVVVLTRDPAGFTHRAGELCAWPGLTLHPGDVRGRDYPDGAFDHVLHLASIPTPPSDGRGILDVVLRGTQRVLEAAAQAGARRLLFVSSGAVYGPQPTDLPAIPESFRGLPEALEDGSANGVGKRAAELLAVLEGRAQGFEVTIARGFALLGPFLPLGGSFAAGNFLRDALAGGPIVVQGDGTPVRSYLYAADMAEWLWTIHLRGRDGRAYNFGGAEELDIATLARRIAVAASPASPVEVRIARPAAPGAEPSRFIPAIDRVREELGLVPTVGLDEGIARTLAYLRRVA